MKNLFPSLTFLLLIVAVVLALDVRWLNLGNAESVHIAVQTTATTSALFTGNDTAVSSDRSPSTPLDLNTATLEELDTLPGIGPKRAEAIVTYREEHGPFSSIESLTQVPGIGYKVLENIRDQVTISAP